MKSVVSAAANPHGVSPASRRPLVRLLGIAPAAFLLSGLLAVWAGPLATPAAASGPTGPVVAWGYNNEGQLDIPAGLSGAAAISAGEYHSIALEADGTVVAWGRNLEGEATVPLALQNPSTAAVTAIAAGGWHSLALESNGTVVGWGWSLDGQATIPADLQSPSTAHVTAISAGGLHSLALKADGTVVAWGSNDADQIAVPSDLQSPSTAHVTAVAAGFRHSMALRSNGTVVAWGWNGGGEATVPPALQDPSTANVAAIAVGVNHSIALRSDGTVVAWGENGVGQTTVPTGLSNVTAIAAGNGFNLALVAPSGPGTIAWGDNDQGQVTLPTGLSGVAAIAAGAFHSLALKADGTVVAWGYGYDGQIEVPPALADPSTGHVTAIAAGYDYSLALKNNGTVVAWGWNGEGETTVPPALADPSTGHVTAIAAGGYHNLALRSDGTVVAWGDDSRHQTEVPATLQDPSTAHVAAIAAGGWHSLVLRADGTIVSWGWDSEGQAAVPATLQDPSAANASAIAGGGYHSLALKSDGTLVAWGRSNEGQITVPATAQWGVKALAGGYMDSIALKSNGTVVVWGDNSSGQNAIPAGLSGVTAISAGKFHYLVLASASASGATYHPLTPTRILNTVDGTGLTGHFYSRHAREFQVTGGISGVPAGATAVTGNLTVTSQTMAGFLYIGPDQMDDPTSSTLNFPLNDDRANGVTVALNSAGRLWVTYAASVPTTPWADVIFDVSGYFTPDGSGATYHALTPTRILDTRDGTGLSGRSSSHVARTFQVTGVGGVPLNAIAVTGNLTVTQQTTLGFLYIGPNAVNNPTSSTLNFPVADDRANGLTVALGPGGTLSVTYAAPTMGPTAHVIFDVTGYYTPDLTGASYHGLTPTRILDTRDGTGGLFGPFHSHLPLSFQVTGGTSGVPASAIAATGNLTVTNQTMYGYLYIGPNQIIDPTSSTLNFPVADDRANGVTVALNGAGQLWVTYAAPAIGPTADVIFDVSGYFVPWPG